MAITTDSYYDIINGGVTYDRIGLSKTLDNYSINDIKEMTFCGAIEDKVRYFGKGEPVGSNDTMVGYTQNISGGCPYIARYIGGQYQYPQLDIGGTDEYNYPDGLQHSVLWLYRETGTYDGVITPTNQSNYKVITEWDAPKYTMHITYDNAKSNIFLIEDNISVLYNTSRGTAGNVQISAIGKPYIIFEHDGKLFFMHAFYFTLLETTAFTYINNSNNSSCMCAFRSYTDSEEYGTAVTMADLCNGDNLNNPANLPAQVSVVDFYNYTGHTMVDGVGAYFTVGSNTGLGVRGVSMRYFYTKIESMLLNIAGAGLYFNVGNVDYKPIISGGWVIGYTDDLEKSSEIDSYRGSTKHTVAPTPPTPKPDSQDNEIDVEMSQFAPSVGFVNYIEMDYETAQHVASAFNTYNQSIWNIGGDLFKNLISYKIFAVYGTHSGTIKNIHIAGHELEYNDAPINGNYIDDLGVVDLGSINVGSAFRFNDWRDFAPYTKIECFVPCCGWCQLPPWVMGRTVTGTMYIDIANGSCKAVIKAGKTPVAEIGGCVAVDVPFSSVATGAKAAGLITAITNGAVSAFNPTPQNLISGSFGILSALNANYTETKGVMGDGSNINGCTQFLIKVTRPASTDTGNGQITDRYKHEKGIPCAKTKTLASGQGFTQITDANIDGTMTDREKQMIVDGFRHGLIL